MNYYKLGFAVSFIIHLLFVVLAFYIKKPATQENMEVVLEFNVTNIIKTGEHETDKNIMDTAEVIENVVSIPAMVKQETKNTVEEKIVEQENKEITYGAEYFKTKKEIKATQDSKETIADVVIKEELPVPDKVKQETEIKTEEKVLEKDVEVTEKVKQAVKETRQESRNDKDAGQSGGISQSDRIQHELDQSAENQYIKEHFDYINKIVRINISYPYKARRMSMEGDIIISFLVCVDGSVKGIKINKSSGFLTLDNNAEKAVRNASPFPPPPVEVRIVIPITYKLNT
jgi:periplasmic protein TonB